MTSNINFTLHADIPVYRQIVSQLSFMIESGDLAPGQALPSARLLADNLHINRNTVARAYAELADLGQVEGKGRSGTIVVGPRSRNEAAVLRERGRALIETALRRCIELGLSPRETHDLVMSLALRASDDLLTISFVECNRDRSTYFAEEIARNVGQRVEPLVLGEFDPSKVRADLVLTTFFHQAEVREQLRARQIEVVAIVVAPHVQTLVEIASVSKRGRVGIWYSSRDQAETIRASLEESGIRNVVVLGSVDDAALAEVELVVVPSEMPGLSELLAGKVRVIEFGNVLDTASIRLVAEVVQDMRRAKAAQIHSSA